jgi:hypothetical protein
VQARLAQTNRQLTPMTAATYRIPLTDENVCVFLAEDRRCMVESQEGLALKPHECQRFPFATVRLPNGSDWHETSAACKSISETLLLAFQPILPRPSSAQGTTAGSTSAMAILGPDQPAQKPSPQKLTAHAVSEDFDEGLDDLCEADLRLQASLEPVALFPRRIPVGGFKTLSQDQYQAYQRELKAVFKTADTHPEGALHQAHALLQAFSAGKGLNHGAQPSQALAQSRFPSAMAGWMVVSFLRKPYRTLSWVNLLLGPTYPDPRIFGMPIHLKQQGAIAWNPELNFHLNAFLFNLLQRKRLIALGSSLSAHLAMAGVACLLVQWYAKTLAWMQGSTQLTEKDLATAIRLVERYYTGHQPRFLALFSSRWRGELIYALLFSVFTTPPKK